jgi:hypothetical protein
MDNTQMNDTDTISTPLLHEAAIAKLYSSVRDLEREYTTIEHIQADDVPEKLEKLDDEIESLKITIEKLETEQSES